MRKLRTQRDNQQWMLDLALNMRGRVQNFERDDLEVPQGKRARNYRMLPKVWREAAERHEALASARRRMGANEAATYHYDHAIEAYRMAQHPIYFDDHPVKIELYRKLSEMVDRRSKVAAYPIERVEVPFGGGKTISCLLHLLPDRRRAPVVIYVPGMDQTKEIFPKAYHNIALSRGFHVLAMDGPGQGNSNLQKIRAVKDNYERAGAAVISYLAKRPEVDPKKIAVYGISMGSYWSLRLSSYDHRAAAVVSSVACFNPNNTIFTQSSPRFKQMFMYMAGMDDEAQLRQGGRERHDRARLSRQGQMPDAARDRRVRSVVPAGGRGRGLPRPQGAEGDVGDRKPVPSAVGSRQPGRDGLPRLRDGLVEGVILGQAHAHEARPHRLRPGERRRAVGEMRLGAPHQARPGLLLTA